MKNIIHIKKSVINAFAGGKSYILLLALILVNLSLSAQISRGDKMYANFNYPEAVKSYKHALKESSEKEEYLSLRIAESYRLMGDYANAEGWYAKVVNTKGVDPVILFYYGKMLESNGKYEEAREWFVKYVERLPKDSRAREYKDFSAEKVADLLEDKGKYEVTNAGEANSMYDDFSPAYFGHKIIFASNRPNTLMTDRKHVWNDMPFIDLYVADQQDDHHLIDANPLPEFNGNWHEGPVVFTSDLSRIYFTRNASRGNNLLKGMNNTTNLMIYTARRTTETDGREMWSKPEALDFNSVEYSCQHPALSADGQKMYFASDQPGGHGGMDIYVTEKTVLGWSKPQNLGPAVNTSGDEVFPFISRSGDIYFASNGHLGVGGLDVFKARAVKDGFARPQNLGAPLNDLKDDFGLVLNESEEGGYFSSNREGGSGRDDIYYVKILEKEEEEEMEEEVIPRSSQLEIFVYDVVTGKGLKEAVVNLFDARGKLIDAVQTDDMGLYTADRHQYVGELRFIASYPEYASVRKVINMETLPEENARIDLPLSKDLGKVTTINGKAININPIYFDYDKANIRSDAAVELNKIIRIMEDNPTMVIEVASHTDSRGNNAYNEDLSQRRARSSREYIINHGIALSRIYGQGYGETQLTNECEDGVECSEAKHQLNRRTEFRIVKF